MEKTRYRNYAFDSLKAIMITLMVFGHLIEEYGYDGIIGIIWVYIYSFHMPVFVFISGYFSKNTDKGIKNAVSSLLIPYLIVDVVFSLFTNDFKISTIDIFRPNYAYWYIFSLFIWRIMIKALSRLKFLFEISIVLALICGYYYSVNYYFSSSRIICFFPFFVIGYYFTENNLKSIKENPKGIFCFLAILASLITIALKYANMIPPRMYLLSTSYSEQGLGFGTGLVYRSIIIVIAFIFILSFINLVPNKENLLSKLGSRTITVYLFSSFFTKAFAVVMKHFDAMPQNPISQILLSIILTIIIVAITGNKIVYKLYSDSINLLNKAIIIKE